jgi:patatin-like phospholipase/acyl hydrolase
MPYRVLSLDGGGSRALLPVAIVQRIQEQREEFLGSVELFAGTSTSGITALALAAADDWTDSVDAVRGLWVQAGKLFATDTLRTVTAMAGKAAYYDHQNLAAALKEIFGDRTMGDLKRKVVVPVLALNAADRSSRDARWEPQILHNFDATFADLTLREAAMRSAAMPILFPTRSNCIDGSLLANNPALCAITQVLHHEKTALKDLRVVSIGSGQNPTGLNVQNSDWGYADWLFDQDMPLALLQAVIENGSQMTEFQCAQLLSAGQYRRLNPALAKAVPIYEHGPRFMVDLGDTADAIDMQPTLEWLDRSGWRLRRPDADARKV